MVDLLVRNGIMVTMDEGKRMFKDGALAIEEGRIIDVGRSQDLEDKYSPDVEIDARGKAILPGLVNTHTHLFQNLLKGKRDDLPLVNWITDVTSQIVGIDYQNILVDNFEIGYQAALLGCIEALKSGTTCLVDMDLRNPHIPLAFKQTGIRAVYALNLADRWMPKEVIRPKDEMMRRVDQIVDQWHGSENGRIRCMYGPSTPFICSRELLQETRELADKRGIGIHIHISETQYERDLVKEETGKPPVEFLHDIGFLGSDVSAAHCVWVSDGELDLLQRTGTKVSHNPESNMKLGSGVAPVPRMLKRGITVSLGTDGCASNDNLDMFEAMRTAAFLHKVSNLSPPIISSYDVMRMATIDGAKTIGMEDEVGSLEVGKKADVILIDLERAHLRPIHDIVNTLVYCANGSDVETVIVDGEIIVQNGKMKTVDEGDAIREADTIIQKYNL